MDDKKNFSLTKLKTDRPSRNKTVSSGDIVQLNQNQYQMFFPIKKSIDFTNNQNEKEKLPTLLGSPEPYIKTTKKISDSSISKTFFSNPLSNQDMPKTKKTSSKKSLITKTHTAQTFSNCKNNKETSKTVRHSQETVSTSSKALICYLESNDYFDRLRHLVAENRNLSIEASKRDRLMLYRSRIAENCWMQSEAAKSSVEREEFFEKYKFSNRPFSAGGYGDVWLAKKIISVDPKTRKLVYEKEDFVIKRLMYREREEVLLSAEREVLFGTRLKSQEHVARFVESYNDTENCIFWIIFYHEGESVYNKLYTVIDLKSASPQVTTSKTWLDMKNDESIYGTVRELIFQLLTAVDSCHSNKVMHRDIKAANVLVDRGGVIKLADFGLSVDTDKHNILYGFEGPPRKNGDYDIAPPEVIFSDMPFSKDCPESFDIWTVGVFLLELILGRRDVFKISSKYESTLRREMENKDEETVLQALKFGAFVEYGIFHPISRSNVAVFRPTMQEREQIFLRKLKESDTTGIGFNDKYGIKFLIKLLEWDPRKRITAKRALTHAFFHGPFECQICRKEFEFKDELSFHICSEHEES